MSDNLLFSLIGTVMILLVIIVFYKSHKNTMRDAENCRGVNGATEGRIAK